MMFVLEKGVRHHTIRTAERSETVMADKNDVRMLKAVLMAFAIVLLIYGIAYLIIPGVLVDLSGSTSIPHGWIRWSGGVLVALGIGSIAVYRKPARQAIFVNTVTLGILLTGLALLFSWISGEGVEATWFIALPTVLALGFALLLLWSSRKAKDVLKSQ
jgi:uncharacterized protein YjeT (DUF2065 family)